jgi:formyltetrahydrofolate hydrolase
LLVAHATEVEEAGLSPLFRSSGADLMVLARYMHVLSTG